MVAVRSHGSNATPACMPAAASARVGCCHFWRRLLVCVGSAGCVSRFPPLSCPPARGVARVLASRAPLRSVAALPASPPTAARVLGHVIGWLVCVSVIVGDRGENKGLVARGSQATAAARSTARTSLLPSLSSPRPRSRHCLLVSVVGGVSAVLCVSGVRLCLVRVGAGALSSTHHPPPCAPTPAAAWSCGRVGPRSRLVGLRSL